MPFWWSRRRRFWYGNNYYKRRKRYSRKPRKRWPRRRRRYRPARRRRRRRRRVKVRRKKQTINIKQWQPDSIRKCHIKGFDVLLLGAEGKQFVCYTNVFDSWTPPKVPGGGGFSVQQYSLGWLYEQYKFRRNIWTSSNILKDLCRYIRCKITLYRHTYTDFIVSYDRQLPFDLNKFTYPDTHPANLLLHKHKKIIPSKLTKPHGRQKIKIIIKPPKQMITKWFFTSQFSSAPLFLLRAAAANFNYSRISPTATNTLIEFFYLNVQFYQNPQWGVAYPQGTQQIYKPYSSAPDHFWVKYIDGKEQKVQLSTTHGVAYKDGYFCSSLLRAVKVKAEQTTPTWNAATPINVARYNPNRDTGKNNSVYLMSILASTYRKPTDEVLFIDGLPLWMALYGFLQYVDTMKKGKGFLDSYILVVQSPAIEPASQIGAQSWYMIIDKEFIEGKGPYGSYTTESTRSKWYPNVWSQQKTINTFVETGPFIPKYSEERQSSWELHYNYDFFFKWGGPEITDPAVANPATQQKYDVPDTIQSAVQIRDPAKQKASSILHCWDVRRGLITQAALKRMSGNIETDTTFQSDSEKIPAKKRKITGPALQNPQEDQEEIQSCLQCLFEEDTFQETKDPSQLYQLIQQQQQQQQQLKYNILRLIADLKDKQKMLQLQTGLME
nr:MAG: ORF1 [Torque teno midi virus]